MSRPRTPEHFPRMKIRGARRRRLAPYQRFARAAAQSAHALSELGLASAHADISMERLAALALAVGQAYPGTLAALAADPGSDAYLADHGGENPPATPAMCPTWFTWSAFGASYPDTECQSGTLLDLDSLSTSDGVPCPMCDPAGHWEQAFGGTSFAPVCLRCHQGISSGTPIVFHERGHALAMAAHCNACRKRTWVGTGEDRSLFADEIPSYEYPAAA